MNVDIPAPARPVLTPHGDGRAVRAGPLPVFSLMMASGAVLISSRCALPLALAMAGLIEPNVVAYLMSLRGEG